jgi:hypothetical protein
MRFRFDLGIQLSQQFFHKTYAYNDKTCLHHNIDLIIKKGLLVLAILNPTIEFLISKIFCNKDEMFYWEWFDGFIFIACCFEL